MVVLAAVVSIGAWGGPAIATHLTVRTGDIVNGQVKTPDLGKGAVTRPKVANQAINSPKLKDGGVLRKDLGNGVVAARALALVNADGTVDAARSKNIAASAVTNPQTGIYCVDLPFTPLSAQTTPHANINTTMNVSLAFDFGGCAGTEVSISTRNSTGLVDRAFMIVIF
ncbi:MAG: hypothetical protein GEU93_10540 [Propionibacteriales bacterium]|nr:hypothetical protein [Propionibacteriales bacterium]